MSYKPPSNTTPASQAPPAANASIDYKKYEDNLIMGVTAVLLGIGYKGVMKREILPVTGARKVIETFLVVTIATILGEEITGKMKKDGYLK